uniref:DUF19 domain-containing protein n=1 Tax=Steinernema glaseri TaxID=37863 RepID=A0A1I7ZEL8_9BILA
MAPFIAPLTLLLNALSFNKMRPLFCHSATKLMNSVPQGNVFPVIQKCSMPVVVGKHLLSCMFAMAHFDIIYGMITKLPEACFVFDEEARVDLKRTVKRAEEVLDPLVLFKLQCATGCTENLVKTWHKCSDEEKQSFCRNVNSVEDIFYYNKANEVWAQSYGLEAGPPPTISFGICVLLEWYEAALDCFRAQSEDEKLIIFFGEWYMSMVEQNFKMFSRLNAVKDFVLRPAYIRDVLARDWDPEWLKNLPELRRRAQVPQDCVVPEIEEFLEEVRSTYS